PALQVASPPVAPAPPPTPVVASPAPPRAPANGYSPPPPPPAFVRREHEPAAAGPRMSETLLAVVAEKTGYPAEMLGLDMSLDADLGIDSIKRVEILAALQERLPAAPVVPPDRLGSLRTLRDVTDLLREAVPEKKTPRPALIAR